ncbi:hypothetical protein [Rubripirellula lacrimiformis]|nr:hypothetical protein [Rubripirellula lacrimiformis]
MTYLDGDSETTRVAPMRLWLDRNELYLETYDVRLTSDADGLTAWVADPLSNHFDSQVLKSKPLSGRPTVAGLIADPILVGRVAAGLAGPPPQLEWLFSDSPMKTLFRDTNHFQYGPTRIVDGRHCPSVVVEADAQRFEFWIDPPTSTIRRVQLPSIVAPLIPGAQPQPIALTIDLVGATFNAPDRAPQIERLPQAPKLVSRFVPLPPPRPARILGTQVRPIRAHSVGRQLTLSSRGIDRPLTALVRLTADQSTAGAVAAAQLWANQMAGEMAKKIRIAVLVDADVPDAVAGQWSLPQFIDARGEIARTLEMDPGAIVLVDDRGFVMWVEPNFSIATLPTLGGVVSDLQSGVDVPERLRKQWSEQVAMYDRECAKAAIRRN